MMRLSVDETPNSRRNIFRQKTFDVFRLKAFISRERERPVAAAANAASVCSTSALITSLTLIRRPTLIHSAVPSQRLTLPTDRRRNRRQNLPIIRYE